MKKLILFLFMALSFMSSFAQEAQVEMADALRSSGKIYVVVATIAVVFLGIVGYLIFLDRRLSKLEKEHK